jgi:hypothetical protein
LTNESPANKAAKLRQDIVSARFSECPFEPERQTVLHLKLSGGYLPKDLMGIVFGAVIPTQEGPRTVRFETMDVGIADREHQIDLRPLRTPQNEDVNLFSVLIAIGRRLGRPWHNDVAGLEYFDPRFPRNVFVFDRMVPVETFVPSPRIGLLPILMTLADDPFNPRSDRMPQQEEFSASVDEDW